MNLYECKTTHDGEVKTFIVQADSFANAEQAFNKFANNNLNSGYELNSIHKSDSLLALENNGNNTVYTSTRNNKPEHNRIGFNVDALQRQTISPTYSHKVIIFD